MMIKTTTQVVAEYTFVNNAQENVKNGIDSA
jgi:hypothetical protein